ncbi:MAG: energy transducer TonB [Xanthomonadales bacterium]|nr:energy transducer TonB [Xanthomonadales bacterium]
MLTLLDAAASPSPGMEEPVQVVSLPRGEDLEVLERRPPSYPRNAARSGKEGWVRLGFVVTETGKVEEIETYQLAAQDDEHERFAARAVTAIKRWEFKPATVAGEPVRRSGRQLMYFTLYPEQLVISPGLDRIGREALEAVSTDDPARLEASLEAMTDLGLLKIGDYGYFDLFSAELARMQGDNALVLAHADRAMPMFRDSPATWAEHRLLRLRFQAYWQTQRLADALDEYATLVEADTALAPDDPIHDLAALVEQELASDQPLVTPGAITPCLLCLDDEPFFGRTLSRPRFSLEARPGSITKLRLICPPAGVDLTWAEGRTWELEDFRKGCSVTVSGEANAEVRLVQHPE